MRRYFSHAEGYVRVKIDGKFCLEHRVIMAAILGRPLQTTEVVHHINGDTQDNRPENLAILDNSTHTRQHAVARRSSSYIVLRCPGCGQYFQRRMNKHRYAIKHNHVEYCSRRCIRPHGAAA